MTGSGEQHEQCVAAELEDIARPRIADRDHAVETVVEEVGQLLCALAAEAGEPFRQLRETGDVGRDEGAFDQLEGCGVAVSTPTEQRPRHVRAKVGCQGNAAVRGYRGRAHRSTQMMRLSASRTRRHMSMRMA